jgi:hypothetical protein
MLASQEAGKLEGLLKDKILLAFKPSGFPAFRPAEGGCGVVPRI